MAVNWSDSGIILVYIIGIFILAWRSGQKVECKDSGVGEYLAGKNLTMRESLLSIVATETSALTFLGIPAFCFSRDFSFLHIYMGAFFGRMIIARFFLPAFYDKGMTIYEIIARKESVNGLRLLSLFFVISKILSVGVRLYSGSILIGQFFQIPISLGIILIAILTFFYTIIGGLKAVVATDSIQFFVFLAGGLLAHYYIPSFAVNSNWQDLMALAHQADKTSLIIFNQEGIKLFIMGLAGGFLFDMATHGVDQDYTQRLLACRNLKSAQRAIFYSSFFSLFLGTLFLGIGALLWGYYQLHPMPEGISPDHLFAYFITQYFPSPLRGIMIAGVLAATMSTLDSTLNALSSCLWNDIFPLQNNKGVRKLSGRVRRHFFSSMMLIGLVSIALLSSLSDSLLLLGLKIASWSGGPLLSLLFLRVIIPSVFPKSLTLRISFSPLIVANAHLCGYIGVALNTFVWEFNWNLNIYFGVIFSFMGILMTEKVIRKE